MTEKNQIYKCEVCGNIVEVLHSGAGELVCCGKPMVLMSEKTKDEGPEKHVPIIDEMIVRVGKTEHPMDDGHYIEWIEIIMENGKRVKKFLKPGDRPEVGFCTKGKVVSARAYCNIHGLWKSEN